MTGLIAGDHDHGHRLADGPAHAPARWRPCMPERGRRAATTKNTARSCVDAQGQGALVVARAARRRMALSRATVMTVGRIINAQQDRLPAQDAVAVARPKTLTHRWAR